MAKPRILSSCVSSHSFTVTPDIGWSGCHEKEGCDENLPDQQHRVFTHRPSPHCEPAKQIETCSGVTRTNSGVTRTGVSTSTEPTVATAVTTHCKATPPFTLTMNSRTSASQKAMYPAIVVKSARYSFGSLFVRFSGNDLRLFSQCQSSETCAKTSTFAL